MRAMEDWDWHDWAGCEEFDNGKRPLIGETLKGEMTIVCSADMIGIYSPVDCSSAFWGRYALPYEEARAVCVMVECTNGTPEELMALGFDFNT